MTEAELEQSLSVVLAVLKFGAMFNPELAPAVTILTAVSQLVKAEGARLRSGLADGSVVSDGRGGYVSRAWADDPRHALNPDGSFKDKSW
jgi:hypothetical protein